MHQNVIDFLKRMRNRYPGPFIGKNILECGSMEVSGGTPRDLFVGPDEYIGIDWRPGDCVDVVTLIHEYHEKPDGYFHTVISTSTLEHDPYWGKSIKRMLELLKEEGTLILTYSGKFTIHCPESSPIKDYYENRNLQEVMEVIKENAEFEVMIMEVEDKDVRIFLDKKK